MKKGFTLVELVIVIVIVGILSIVAVPIYKGYVEKAKMTEGMALAGAVMQAQKIYYAEHGTYYMDGITGIAQRAQYNDILGIDTRSNKYYKYFYISSNSTALSAWTTQESNSDMRVGITTYTDGRRDKLQTYDGKTGTYVDLK